MWNKKIAKLKLGIRRPYLIAPVSGSEIVPGKNEIPLQKVAAKV